jgi:hypothetical protein
MTTSSSSSSVRYVLHLKDTDYFLHFDPRRDAYFIGDGLKGACIFDRENALGMASQISNEQNSWLVVELNTRGVQRTTVPKSEETKIFDQTRS